MKITSTEHSVRLVPESDWEKEQLARICHAGVEKVQFEDAWAGKGALIIEFRKHPFDEEKPR